MLLRNVAFALIFLKLFVRGIRAHKSIPLPSPAIEIFSVFIGREKSSTPKIYGSIEILCGYRRLCYILKREEKDALWLSEHTNSISILDDSREYEEFQPLSVKVDIKDAYGRLGVKGYVNWDAAILDASSYRNKLLCSFIQGQEGFTALHYCIFTDAVAACIKLFVNRKLRFTDADSKIYGSVVSQYDYSSRYNQDFYRTKLFMRTEDESLQLNDDGTIPLSRSMVVVPSYSSLIINIDLSVGVSGQKLLSCSQTIAIGDRRKTVETSDCDLDIEIDWCEIK